MDRLSYLTGTCVGTFLGIGYSTSVIGFYSRPCPKTSPDDDDLIIVQTRPASFALTTAGVLVVALGSILLYHKLSSE